MCGGAIISYFDPLVSRSSRRVTAELLWGSAAVDLNKKRGGNSPAKRSRPIAGSYDDFETDFENFRDGTDDEGEIKVKMPVAQAVSKNPGSKGNGHSFFFSFFCSTFFPCYRYV